LEISKNSPVVGGHEARRASRRGAVTAAMRSGARAVAVVLALGLAATVGPPAQATFLRNGLRPGGPGTPGFQHPPPPGAPVRIRPPGEPAVQAARTPGPRQARFRWFWRAVSPE